MATTTIIPKTFRTRSHWENWRHNCEAFFFREKLNDSLVMYKKRKKNMNAICVLFAWQFFFLHFHSLAFRWSYCELSFAMPFPWIKVKLEVEEVFTCILALRKIRLYKWYVTTNSFSFMKNCVWCACSQCQSGQQIAFSAMDWRKCFFIFSV